MVTFRIIAVGRPPRDWRLEAFQHYVKLISTCATVEEAFVKEQQVHDSQGVQAAIRKEADSLLKSLHDNAYHIALDKSGTLRSSEELAAHLESLFQVHSRFNLLIGGPYGLHDSLLRAVDETISLSQLTFPHDLARIIVVEQLYRAMAILNNLPYHK